MSWQLKLQQRWEHLYALEGDLSYRFDLKRSLGCTKVSALCPPIQARVLASTCGMWGDDNDKEVQDLVFRWLFAHAGSSVDNFCTTRTHSQSSQILHTYMLDNGRFSEIALLQSVYKGVLRHPSGHLLDIYMADRDADKNRATDWVAKILIQNRICHVGLQVMLGNNYGSKIDQIIRIFSPESGIRQGKGYKPNSVAADFVRDSLIVSKFHHFNPSGEARKKAISSILAQKSDYLHRFWSSSRSHFSDANYSRAFVDAVKICCQMILEIDEKTIRRWQSHLTRKSKRNTLFLDGEYGDKSGAIAIRKTINGNNFLQIRQSREENGQNPLVTLMIPIKHFEYLKQFSQ